MEVRFDNEPLNRVRREIDSLLDLNYEELTLNKDKVKLDPDWDRYQELEDARKLIIFTARTDKLIGYAFFFIDTHIHYKNLVVANNDVIFLHPDYRVGRVGIKFLKYCDSNLDLVDKITWHVKTTRDFGPILSRMGYYQEDIIMGKIN